MKVEETHVPVIVNVIKSVQAQYQWRNTAVVPLLGYCCICVLVSPIWLASFPILEPTWRVSYIRLRSCWFTVLENCMISKICVTWGYFNVFFYWAHFCFLKICLWSTRRKQKKRMRKHLFLIFVCFWSTCFKIIFKTLQILDEKLIYE